ncbi:MAG: orotidine-5'-phosphate decarboxylase, partial [Gemmatimonas sp.]
MNAPPLSARRDATAANTPNAVTPIVALDVADAHAARELVARLGDRCRIYKVGLELFTSEGIGIVEWLRDSGHQVFLDLKLHDIPNTVHGAARSASRLGVSLLTVHAAGGADMVRASVAGAAEGTGTASAAAGCEILGVTVLTSMD